MSSVEKQFQADEQYKNQNHRHTHGKIGYTATFLFHIKNTETD